MANLDDEEKDPLEAMDEKEEDGDDGDIDPKALAKKGMSIVGEDDILPEVAEVSPEEELLEKDPLLPDVEIPEDEGEVDLEDEEFSDGPEW